MPNLSVNSFVRIISLIGIKITELVINPKKIDALKINGKLNEVLPKIQEQEKSISKKGLEISEISSVVLKAKNDKFCAVEIYTKKPDCKDLLYGLKITAVLPLNNITEKSASQKTDFNSVLNSINKK
jgi:hypothetical protein